MRRTRQSCVPAEGTAVRAAPDHNSISTRPLQARCIGLVSASAVEVPMLAVRRALSAHSH